MPQNNDPSKSPTVCIAICTKGRLSLEKLLDSLAHQETLPQRVVIINDSGLDKIPGLTPDFKKELGQQLSVIPSNHRNIAHARNLGLRACNEDILVFIDDDVVVEDTLVSDVKKLVQTYPNALGFVGPVLASGNDLFSKASAYFYNAEFRHMKEPTPITMASFALIVFNLTHIRQRKLEFPEELSTGEDHAFISWAVTEKNKLYFIPNLQSKHDFFADGFWPYFKRYFLYGKDAAALAAYSSIDNFWIRSKFPLSRKECKLLNLAYKTIARDLIIAVVSAKKAVEALHKEIYPISYVVPLFAIYFLYLFGMLKTKAGKDFFNTA